MIRELTTNEYLSILELGNICDEDFTLEKISSTDKVIGYYFDNKIIGFLCYNKLYKTIDVLYIAVKKEYQRQGIGKNLMNYIYNINGITHILLEVNEINKQALYFYESQGFKVIRTIKNYYGKNNGLVMERIM